MKQIEIKSGVFSIVDDEDYEYLKFFKWSLIGGYAVCEAGKMERMVLEIPDGTILDHVNRNKLDNRKCNLRICNPSQNGKNKSKFLTNTSGYKGVSKKGDRWIVQIKSDYKNYYIGTFDDKIMAALAYDEAAERLHEDFAALNFPAYSSKNEMKPKPVVGFFKKILGFKDAL